MKADLRAWPWVRERRGGALALVWVAALVLTLVVRMQLAQVRQTAAVVNFLANVSELARARPDTTERDWLLRLAQRPDAVASQEALLERRTNRLELTGGFVLVMYAALILATWSWLKGRAMRAPRVS